MKYFTLFLLLTVTGFIAPSTSSAQNIFFCGYGEAVLPGDICDFNRARRFSNDEEAESAVEQVLKKLGLPKNFALAECPDMDNCVAITDEKGVRYILYDSDFIKRIKSQTSDWSALSILTHEIGHHLSGHTNKGAEDLKESRKFELEADYFTGYQMYRLGATLEQAQEAVREVASDRDDRFSSHPKRSKRLAAIEEGYLEARGNEERPGPAKEADISIAYTGDFYGCNLPIEIMIADKTIRPVGNSFDVSGIPVGEQNYTIRGQIHCRAIGSCQVFSQGTIHIADGATYFIGWQNVAYAQCRMWLQKQL